LFKRTNKTKKHQSTSLESKQKLLLHFKQTNKQTIDCWHRFVIPRAMDLVLNERHVYRLCCMYFCNEKYRLSHYCHGSSCLYAVPTAPEIQPWLVLSPAKSVPHSLRSCIQLEAEEISTAERIVYN